MRRKSYATLFTLCSLALIAGCTEIEFKRMFDWSARKPQPEPDLATAPDTIAMRDTIGPLVSVQGMALNHVRGFGLVVDLVDTGGSDGPEIVRNHLIKEIRRRAEIGGDGINASEFIDSRGTAMVEIDGFIPGGAQKGERFDIRLRALGTETTSLVGGRLVLASMQVWAETPSGVLSGKPQAVAQGPVYVPPFNNAGKPSENIDLRRALVLGGGMVKSDRKVRLVLNDPRYSVAKQIERTINSRYGGSEKYAVGESPSYIELKFPREMRHDKLLFIERVMLTTMSTDTGVLEKRADELVAAMKDSDTEKLSSTALALEAIGKPSVVKLAALLDSSSNATHYYASRTLLRLGEREGAIGVGRHAHDANGEFRMEAIAELGRADRQYAAGEQLRRLFDDEDDEIRIAAYRALRGRAHPAIKSFVLDQDNMILDVIDCRGRPLIYAQQRGEPRLAIFGKRMMCKPPAIFPGLRNDGRVLLTQLSANKGDRNLKLIYRNKRTGATSPTIEAPISIPELVRFLADTPRTGGSKPRGFAVPYSEIVDIISALCETGSSNAKFVVEKIGKAQDAGVERGETEIE